MQLDAPHVRARLLNTTSCAVVAPGGWPRGSTPRRALALLAALACAVALAACAGSGSPGAQSLLSETFKSHQPIESGRMLLSYALAPAAAGGPAAVAGGLSLALAGPFQGAGTGRLPRFALQAELGSGAAPGSAGQALHLGAVSTAGKLFIELGGTPFLAPAATVEAVQQGYAQASRAASAGPSSFTALGVDPGDWLTHPTVAGRAEVAGEQTIHIVAGLDATRFFADAARLSLLLRPLGLAGGHGSGLFARSEPGAFESSLRSARVDVYTGSGDHLLRRLSVRANLAAPSDAPGALGGLRSATLTLVLQFTQLNRPQRILAPGAVQPIAKLVPVLERLGLLGPPRPRG